MFAWMHAFIGQRRQEPPRGDVVDAILAAEIDGRPITDGEIFGIIQLLILGGLETTAGALGQWIIRFSRQPEIPARLAREPGLVPDAVEELLRLDPPFVSVGRTVVEDAEIAGHQIKKGDHVMVSWLSANRDEAEFDDSDTFNPERERNRHLAFGAGPHRCAGSTLARLNLRIALEELTRRVHDIRLADDAEPIPYHQAFNRSPLQLPITFTPGPRIGAPAAASVATP
jgi:cytochrome P450